MPHTAPPGKAMGVESPRHKKGAEEMCASCKASGVPLLACDSPENELGAESGVKPRFCSNCMIGKKVKVFWPVDNSWYNGIVQEYDADTGEHLLRYPDGDSEWVRIGETNTTGVNSTDTSGPMSPSVGLDPSVTMSPKWQEHPLLGPPRGPHGMHYPPGFPPFSSPYLPPNMYGMVFSPGIDLHGQGSSPTNNGGKDSSPGTGRLDMEDGSKSRKSGPKAWTKDEDAILLTVVQSMKMPIKWSVVAVNLNDRTGKQCRERYVNHLNPRLKVTEWNLVEDYTIFRLYNTIGSHWATLSKAIPGRTDNGIKNRFHNVRRQAEREDENRLKIHTAKDYEKHIRIDRVRGIPPHLRSKSEELWDQEAALGMISSELFAKELTLKSSMEVFGKMKKAEPGTICVRCGLLMPSVETGSEVCSSTGWCITCTRTPSYLTDNILRQCHFLLRATDPQKRAIIESWKDPLKAKSQKAK